MAPLQASGEVAEGVFRSIYGLVLPELGKKRRGRTTRTFASLLPPALNSFPALFQSGPDAHAMLPSGCEALRACKDLSGSRRALQSLVLVLLCAVSVLSTSRVLRNEQCNFTCPLQPFELGPGALTCSAHSLVKEEDSPFSDFLFVFLRSERPVLRNPWEAGLTGGEC